MMQKSSVGKEVETLGIETSVEIIENCASMMGIYRRYLCNST